MKTNTVILKAFGQYWLWVESAYSVDSGYQFAKLIGSGRLVDVLELASSLQLHVDNSAELALNQYRRIG